MDIDDFTVYADFERSPLNKYQTVLRKMGFQTRHSSIQGKSCSDLELTVDALRDLYKNQFLKIFVIITSDRDLIPLLKSINSENKISYVFSTKSNFNPVLCQYSLFHVFIEDLFSLGELKAPVTSVKTLTVNRDFIDPPAFDPSCAGAQVFAPEKVERAREVANYFYKSKIWRNSMKGGILITLKGYLEVIAKVLNRATNELLDDFKLADSLRYLSIFEDKDKGLCLKEGELAGMFIKES